MMKRCLSLLLVVALIAVLVVPVTAHADGGNKGGWYEILEQSSVRENGENWFKIDGTQGEFVIQLPAQTRLAKLDLLISYQSGALPSTIYVVAGENEYPLKIVKINESLCRIYGNISFGYTGQLKFRVVKGNATTAYYEVLSCRASTVSVTDTPVQGKLYRSFSDSSPLTLPNNFSVSAYGESENFEYKLIPVRITDWQKYDYVTLFGSATSMAISSFRAAIGLKGLPYTITYMEAIPTTYEGSEWGSYDYVSGTETHYYENIDVDEYSKTEGTLAGDSATYGNIVYGAAVLYTITIDLTGIDRTSTDLLDCYFTCVCAPSYGYAFNVQNASGSVVTADTSSVSWWTRFTNFMNDLFGAKEDSGALDDLGSSSDSISQNTSQIHDFEQSQQAVLDNNFAQIQGAISFTNFAAALVFVQKYTNMTFNGISEYAIVFTLPLFLGLFFYLCSRIPGITRWKTPPPRSPSPKSKGGGKT